ncbi:MAG: chaperone modulator CbpM [Verrucomicrobiaceae bacterium]
MTCHYQLITVSESSEPDSVFTSLSEAAEITGLHPEMIEEFLRGSLVHAFKDSAGVIFFDPSGITRLRQLAHLRQHEQISLRMTRYIASLLDSLEAREQELHTLREQLR